MKVNIKDQLGEISEHWSPKVVAQLNGQEVKLVKFQGEFHLHQHTNEDELFFVVKGSFEMVFDDRSESINEGEFIVVPRGVFHKPVAEEECEVMLFEPASTIRTGD
jgi:mannose-6-phosphate isomerase-like protein (cupin superfamily)